MSSHWVPVKGLGGNPSEQRQPPPPPPTPVFLWDVLDMLLMSVGSCVFFLCPESLGGSGSIFCVSLLCGPEPPSHRPEPSFLSQLRAEPLVQDGR